MALAWFICPYLIGVEDNGASKFRYCAMNNFNAQIFGDAGDWSETEVLGDAALVKVRASDATLATIQAATGFIKVLNKIELTDTMTNLTTVQRNVVQNKLLSMGYTQAEIDAAMGSNLAAWRAHTYGDLLNLIAAKRLKPLSITDHTIFTDTIVIPLRPAVVANRVR